MDCAAFIPASAGRPATASCLSAWRQQKHSLRNELAQLLTARYLAESNAGLHNQLDDFCSNMLDYVCAGHFLVYHELAATQRTTDPGTRALRAHILKFIGNTTDHILNFNEQLMLDCDDPALQRADDQLLAKLIRVLLMRFALEEQLIELDNIGQLQLSEQ